jgi:hypothetical protein
MQTMVNHEADPMQAIEDLIDRVVEGGMMPDELRKSIERLDAAPDGWRRCALAFLEAQGWAEAFRSMYGSIVRDLPENSGDSPPRSFATLNPAPSTLAAAPRWRLFAVSLAAGIALVAFSLGWLSHGVRLHNDLERNAPPALAADLKTPESQLEEAPQFASPSEPLQPGSIAGLLTDRVPTVREVARLRIGTGDVTSAEVPIFAGPGVSQRWLLEQPPPVSEHDRAIWQRQGYQLEQQRRLLSVPLADGRRATVPVDHVQVRFVGQVPL